MRARLKKRRLSPGLSQADRTLRLASPSAKPLCHVTHLLSDSIQESLLWFLWELYYKLRTRRSALSPEIDLFLMAGSMFIRTKDKVEDSLCFLLSDRENTSLTPSTPASSLPQPPIYSHTWQLFFEQGTLSPHRLLYCLHILTKTCIVSACFIVCITEVPPCRRIKKKWINVSKTIRTIPSIQWKSDKFWLWRVGT